MVRLASLTGALGLALWLGTGAAHAQSPAVQPLPPPAQPLPQPAQPLPQPAQPQPLPPPPYGYPPPGYYPYPYPYPYPQPAPPPVLPPAAPPAAPPGPLFMDYEEGQPIPPGYALQERRRTGLLIGGGAAFVMPYLASAYAGLFLVAVEDRLDEEPEYWPLFVPVAGPFIAIGTAEPDAGVVALLIADGAAQAVGAPLFILGLAWPEKRLARVARGPELTPVITPSGVGLTGRF